MLPSNANTTIQNSGDDLLFSTDNFDKNQTIYLQNDLFYGSSSYQAKVQLQFSVKGCDLVKINFNPEIEKLNGFPYQKIEQLTSTDETSTITKNMSTAFLSQDPVNCPVKAYKFEKVNLYDSNQIK